MEIDRQIRLLAAGARIAAVILTCGVLSAEQGVLVLHVSTPKSRPIAGVVLGAQGDGAAGPPTDKAGKTRIQLAPGTRAGGWVSLQIVSSQQDLVFISPWDGRVRVPPFENESENFAPVVLAARGDRALLEQGQTLASIAAGINASSAPKSQTATVTDAQRAEALADVSRAFGLSSADVDRAIRTVGAASKDPYERGMSALYQRDYSQATQQLEQSLEIRERQLRRVTGNIVNSAMFLGQALYEQGNYKEAAAAYRKALALRPEDPGLLNAMGLALLKSGKASEAETFFEHALELHEQDAK